MLSKVELQKEAAMLTVDASYLRRRFDHASSACIKCRPTEERGRIRDALLRHRRAMDAAGIPFNFVLLRGSAFHLPFARRLAFHYRFPYDSCGICLSHREKFDHVLKKVKTAPEDIDFVTIGIPQNRARDFLSIASEHEKQGLGLHAHITDHQIAHPSHTYSSFFNWSMKLRIPHMQEEVNPIKFARHLAAMTYFLFAYPVVAAHPSTRKRHERELRVIRRRSQRHLRTLTVPQLREFNRVMKWCLSREGYSLYNLGGSKAERHAAISRPSAQSSRDIEGFGKELIFHLSEMHSYDRRHK